MLSKYRDVCVLCLHCLASQMVSLVQIKAFPLSDKSESRISQDRKSVCGSCAYHLNTNACWINILVGPAGLF